MLAMARSLKPRVGNVSSRTELGLVLSRLGDGARR